MLTIIDLKAELAKLKMLRGRTPETPEAEREGAFARLAPYHHGAIFTGKSAGEDVRGDPLVQLPRCRRRPRQRDGASGGRKAWMTAEEVRLGPTANCPVPAQRQTIPSFLSGAYLPML